MQTIHATSGSHRRGKVWSQKKICYCSIGQVWCMKVIVFCEAQCLEFHFNSSLNPEWQQSQFCDFVT